MVEYRRGLNIVHRINVVWNWILDPNLLLQPVACSLVAEDDINNNTYQKRLYTRIESEIVKLRSDIKSLKTEPKRNIPGPLHWYVDGKLRLVRWMMRTFYRPLRNRPVVKHWFRTKEDDEKDGNNSSPPYSSYSFRYYLPLKPDMESNDVAACKKLKPEIEQLKLPSTLLEKCLNVTMTRSSDIKAKDPNPKTKNQTEIERRSNR